MNGLDVVKPDHVTGREHNENDVVVIYETLKYVLIIECKLTLNKQPPESGEKQLARMKQFLETYFGRELPPQSDWRFLGLLYYQNKVITCQCQDCEKIIACGKTELQTKL